MGFDGMGFNWISLSLLRESLERYPFRVKDFQEINSADAEFDQPNFPPRRGARRAGWVRLCYFRPPSAIAESLRGMFIFLEVP